MFFSGLIFNCPGTLLTAGAFLSIMQLRDYQDKAVTEVAKMLASGKRKLIFQLATGGGKTVTFSAIVKRYHEKSGKRTLILCHREELVKQARKTLYEWYGIDAQNITAETKRIFNKNYYIGMCETVYRRMCKNPKYLPEIGLVIVDEAHIGNFSKLYDMFPSSYIIGFTATPLSATKKDPLKNRFEDIVCGVDIPELIESGSLCQNRTYSPKNVNTSAFKITRGEYDETQMGNEFSKAKYIQNTVDCYTKYGNGKTVVFNCNINHSVLVTGAFKEAGYPCRHLDGESTNRAEIIEWFRKTPDAILCNVGVATTGFDEPSIKTVIMNRATLSLPLWLQCTGRGSRPYKDKPYFTIIDMGNNTTLHGDWCNPRDWYGLFHNPPKAKDKLGVAPVKECPKCQAIIAAQARTCSVCEFAIPVKEVEYDTLPIELQLVTKNLNIASLVEVNAGRKDYFTLFQIGNNLATQAKYKLKAIDAVKVDAIYQLYEEKAKEWCHLKKKRWNDFHRDLTRKHLITQLQKSFPAAQIN